MTAKMEARFRHEQQARQLAQRDTMNGLKNEENASQTDNQRKDHTV